MKEIQLPCGSVVLVDDEDYEYLNQWKWCVGKSPSGNVLRSTPSRTFYLHVEVAKRAGIWVPGLQVDHKDRDRLNNQRFNLRPATDAQNRQNTGPRRNNKTGFKGVFLEPWGKWRAQIKANKKAVYLGQFSTPEAAALAYNQAARIHHGEFACLNVIPQPMSPDGEREPVSAAEEAT